MESAEPSVNERLSGRLPTVDDGEDPLQNGFRIHANRGHDVAGRPEWQKIIGDTDTGEVLLHPCVRERFHHCRAAPGTGLNSGGGTRRQPHITALMGG